MRDHKKGSLWRGPHIKGFQAFSGSGSITCFITFPDSSTKYFETPAIQIGAVLENGEASGLFANDVTRYHIDRQRRKRGKGGVTRSARSPCPLPALYLLTPHHHLLVNVLPPPKLVWNISKSKPGHPHSSDVPFDSETSSVAENITRVNI